jgi:hypothetical protein
MKPSTGIADNRFIFVVLRIVIVIQPVLDLHFSYGTGELQGAHPALIGWAELAAMIWLK